MSSFELPDFESLEELDKITKALDELEKSFSGKINELINTELPNLPDPPSLPTMSTKLKEMVDTLTIILSAMCKLGLMSTKVPEWRV
jgi:hypothetical protein